MKQLDIHTTIKIYSPDELSAEEQQLVEAAKKATTRSYAPYSHFHVGAAALLANGEIISGTNQENAAYPSGICAERTTLFYANSQHPQEAVKALAIAARTSEGHWTETPISPCGACRQVMTETENRFGKPMKVLLCSAQEVFVIESAKDLLPVSFGSEDLK
jgi:cytidine deaminase